MAIGRPNPRKGKGLLAWRSRQRKGAIMKPSTFEGIKKEAMSRGLSEERASKEAGMAYWQAARKKYKKGRSK